MWDEPGEHLYPAIVFGGWPGEGPEETIPEVNGRYIRVDLIQGYYAIGTVPSYKHKQGYGDDEVLPTKKRK